MNRNLLQTVVRHAEVLAAAPSRASDAELLERFTKSKDEAAFAEIVRRHGPMVWAVCRHTLSDPSDADDAFQATFLALVRSANTIRSGSAVGGWLHGVAVRVCTKVRRAEVRRRQREHKVACPEADRPVPDSTWDGLLAAVHEEVQKLPDAERTAFVLCDLEGVRQPDAAERLGWKLGTLSGRLTKARQRLLERLTSRGLAPALAAGGLGVGATANAAVPDDLVHNAVVLSRAGDAVPPVILKLVTGVVPMSRTKLFAAAVFAVGGLAVGSGLMASADAQPPAVVNEVRSLLGSADGGGQPPGREAPRGGQPPAGTPAQGGPPRGGSGVQGLPPGSSAGGLPLGQGGPGGPPPGMSGPPMGGIPPGMSMGGPGGMMGGGMSMAGPSRPQWEYQFNDRPGSADDFKRVLRAQGDAGWEYCGTGPGEILVFKRPKNAPVGGMMMGGGGMGFPGGLGGGGGAMGPSGGTGSAGGGGNRGGGGRGSSGGPVGGEGGGPGGRGADAGAGASSSMFETIPLKNAKAADLVNAITKLFPAVQLTAERGSNSVIIVKASPKEATSIRTLLEGVDKHPNPTAATLETLSGSLGGGTWTPSGGGPPPRGTVADGLSALGVLGGRAASSPGNPIARKMDLTTITLNRGEAADVLVLVMQMLDGRDFKLNVVPGANALILYADAETTKFAQQVIEAIDKVPPAKKTSK